MIRRSVALAALATLAGVLAVPALADTPAGITTQPSKGGHSLCIGASDGNPNTLDGVCVWIPGK